MENYLLALAISLSVFSEPSQAGSADVARATERFWNRVGLTAWIAFVPAPPLFGVVSLIRGVAKSEHKRANQPIYFKSGPSIFGDDLKLVPPQKPAATPYDVVRQMIIHNNSI